MTDTITSILNWAILIYILFPLLFLVSIALTFFFKGKVNLENSDKIIDFSKWYFVSVAIVFAGKSIESGFSERETGIKEMQVYDKYVNTILEADNIESRWKLAEYFSTVTPTERLRARWLEYKVLLTSDYEKFLNLQMQEQTLLKRDSLTLDQKETLSNIQQEKASLDRRLVDSRSGNWVIIFAGDKTFEEAEFEQRKLQKLGIENPKIIFRGNSFRTVSKSFGSQVSAMEYLNSIKDKVRNDSYIIDFIKWCPNEVFNGKNFECI